MYLILTIYPKFEQLQYRTSSTFAKNLESCQCPIPFTQLGKWHDLNDLLSGVAKRTYNKEIRFKYKIFIPKKKHSQSSALVITLEYRKIYPHSQTSNFFIEKTCNN